MSFPILLEKSETSGSLAGFVVPTLAGLKIELAGALDVAWHPSPLFVGPAEVPAAFGVTSRAGGLKELRRTDVVRCNRPRTVGENHPKGVASWKPLAVTCLLVQRHGARHILGDADSSLITPRELGAAVLRPSITGSLMQLRSPYEIAVDSVPSFIHEAEVGARPKRRLIAGLPNEVDGPTLVELNAATHAVHVA